MAWFRKSAEQNDPGAQYGIGLLYEHGKGVTQDITQATLWYKKAAEGGDEQAKAKLEELGDQGQQRAEAVRSGIPPALQFRCLLESDVGTLRPETAPDPKQLERAHDACLRTNWKKLFGDRPFPGD
jgi:TPR repeat protein